MCKLSRLGENKRSRDSSVSIATGYGLDGRVVGVRVKNFHFSTSSRPALGYTQPPIQWVPGALSPGVKRPGREADHSLPTSAEIKKNIDLHIHVPIRLHGIVLSQLSTGITLPFALRENKLDLSFV
jgi:hypothetical protein